MITVQEELIRQILVKISAKACCSTKKLNNTSSTPFDSIMNEIEAFDNTNKKKQKDKKAREQKSTDGNDINKEAASSSKMMSSNLPPTPLPSSYLALTRAEVARSDVEDSNMVRKFLKKDGLMERILGYKMMRGRVEPYNIMKLVVNLDDCVSPVYEQNAQNFARTLLLIIHILERGTLNVPEAQRSKPSHHRPATSRVLDLCSPSQNQKPSGTSPSPNRPTSLVARRGPQTPPGSPNLADMHNNNSSRSSTTHLENDQEAGSKSNLNQTSLPPPPVFPNLSDNTELANDRAALLQQMASLTNTSVAQLEDFMGEDLQNAIGKMDKSVLLSTLKNALRDVTTARILK
uniref:Uncharacterized protein n=1 Tax=Ditylenchus dipsaci TaxID=166011 RepID=A0A915DGR0_9BILA